MVQGWWEEEEEEEAAEEGEGQKASKEEGKQQMKDEKKSLLALRAKKPNLRHRHATALLCQQGKRRKGSIPATRCPRLLLPWTSTLGQG